MKMQSCKWLMREIRSILLFGLCALGVVDHIAWAQDETKSEPTILTDDFQLPAIFRRRHIKTALSDGGACANRRQFSMSIQFYLRRVHSIPSLVLGLAIIGSMGALSADQESTIIGSDLEAKTSEQDVMVLRQLRTQVANPGSLEVEVNCGSITVLADESTEGVEIVAGTIKLQGVDATEKVRSAQLQLGDHSKGVAGNKSKARTALSMVTGSFRIICNDGQ